MSLRRILGGIENEAKNSEVFKDELYEAMRKATRISKQAIFALHRGEPKKSADLLRNAAKLFSKLDEVPLASRQLAYSGIVDAAFQEYAEAHILLNLTERGRFVDPKKIVVPSSSYLLGLADVIGELRRRALDSLRAGDLKTAEKSLEYMELVYDELMGLDRALQSLHELRRKTDVARRVIEATRGDVALEARRDSLERSIKRLEKTIHAEARKER
jgi:translin